MKIHKQVRSCFVRWTSRAVILNVSRLLENVRFWKLIQAVRTSSWVREKGGFRRPLEYSPRLSWRPKYSRHANTDEENDEVSPEVGPHWWTSADGAVDRNLAVSCGVWTGRTDGIGGFYHDKQ